jgi:hypothetical protein
MGGGGSSDGGGGGESGNNGNTNGNGNNGNTGNNSRDACDRAQATAYTRCANAGNSDLSGPNAGGDMVSQGMACSQAQAAANQACQK